MADAAVQIAREAKGLQQGLKESLKNRDITDREIDIQRKNLRRQYLRLLFLHPYAKESKDAETHLWMQTSYSIIAIYKQRIAALDRAIHNPPRQGAQQQSHNRSVEYRKLLQRFRQFLAEEEKFWMQLVLRLRRYFALDDAQSALIVLGITPEDDPAPAVDSAGYPRRNQHQFPPESDLVDEAVPVPTTTSQRENRMAILSKALVCLGDIARYKEQYNEAGGRPRAGHEDGPPAASAGRGGRGRRGGAVGVALPRLRNYDRAQSCYEQARLMLPHDGNPSHQLAILSSYQKDTLSSIMHYYRALCVRSPYETASENLGTVLHKALEQFKTKGLLREAEVQEELTTGTTIPPRLRVESFKEKVVVLHAQWCMNVDDARSMGEKVAEEFSGLVTDRILPIEMISKIIILAQGALWKHRMIRRPSNAEKRSSRLAVTESNIVTHLIATHRVLLENGIVELAEAPPEDAAEGDLAQCITATFRRTLPALRMAGKWLRSNTRYLSQGLKQTVDGDDEAVARDVKGRDRRSGNSAIVIGGIHEFWQEYAHFSTSLIRTFPVEKLPELTTQLEEDVDMAGFLPLRKYMTGNDGRPLGTSRHSTMDSAKVSMGLQDSQELCPPRDQVHPNEEQLMRIADIVADAKAIAEDEYTPVLFDQSQFTLKSALSASTAKLPEIKTTETKPVSLNRVGLMEQLLSSVRSEHVPGNAFATPFREPDEEEDAVSVTTRTEDDLVHLAFEIGLGGSDDDVWQPSGPLSPREDPILATLPTTPPRPRPDPIGTNSIGITPRRQEPLSPPFVPTDLQRSPGAINTPLTTAQDLLQNVLGVHRPPPPAHHQRTLSSSAVNLIPGSSSIWSANDISPLHQSNGTRGLGGTRYVPHPEPNQTTTGPPGPPGQSPWPPSNPWQSPTHAQNNQYSYTTSLSRQYVPPQPSLMSSSHHRIPSETMNPSRANALPSVLPTHHYEPLNPPISLNNASAGGAYGVPGGGINDRFAPGGYGEFFPSTASGHAAYFQGTSQPDPFHSGHTRVNTGEHPYSPPYDNPPMPSLSRIWGNHG